MKTCQSHIVWHQFKAVINRLVCACGAEKLVLSLLKNFILSALYSVDTVRKHLIKFDDKDNMMAAL
jgi:hypothetical protein